MAREADPMALQEEGGFAPRTGANYTAACRTYRLHAMVTTKLPGWEMAKYAADLSMSRQGGVGQRAGGYSPRACGIKPSSCKADFTMARRAAASSFFRISILIAYI